MEKEDFTEVEYILLNDHLKYIGDIHSEYGTAMPIDVHKALMDDVRAIIARMQVEYKKLTGKDVDLASITRKG